MIPKVPMLVFLLEALSTSLFKVYMKQAEQVMLCYFPSRAVCFAVFLVLPFPWKIGSFNIEAKTEQTWFFPFIQKKFSSWVISALPHPLRTLTSFIFLDPKDPIAIERLNLMNMAKLSIKGLIESALNLGRTLDSDYAPLQQFFVVMEHCLKHGLKST